jgi:hypothetical protein
MVRALTPITDNLTGLLHMTGETWDLALPADALRRLMHQGLIEIIDPAVTPAIIVAEPAPRPAVDEED